jgi:hypothetical protein
VVDLDWTAIGDVYKEKVSESGKRANHRTRDAVVTAGGTVEIWDGSTLWFTVGPDDPYGSVITHYTEIQNSNLR